MIGANLSKWTMRYFAIGSVWLIAADALMAAGRCQVFSSRGAERNEGNIAMADYIEVDVRPILRSGGEPFSVIMAALGRLDPGQGIRLYATFKPIPLFAVMAEKGFAHSVKELDGGEWEVLFTPAESAPAAPSLQPAPFEVWPDPVVRLDNRDLDPPEPMVRILGAAEQLAPGQTLSALLRREPVFLFPHLEKRGFRWLGGFTPDGSTYELTVRAPS
jgi:uncharacterized protein (DUF2249 family)